ncbi:MAG: AAA family ATPase, partial [Patescibacteria group bacterium]
MYLKSLELSGFKSFAKRSTLTFAAPISAIVGPNGSGKSNVAEAFRFVLGEQSMKSLRSKRGEDLIFNGAGEGGRANRASVKLVFDNSRHFLPLDFEEVSVERIVYRDSLNEYSINGSKVRLKDVVELLAPAHIGASGHHIISQGEADRILNASSRDRKEMIEDGLGLKIYQYKRLESERKLLKIDENIKSVASLRREIAPHIRFLERQVEKVEKAKAMKGQLVVLCTQYFSREEAYLSATRRALDEKIKGPKEALEKLERELAGAKKTLEGASSKDERLQEVISLEGKIKAAREEKDSLIRDLGRLEGEITSSEKVRAREETLARERSQESISADKLESLISLYEQESKGAKDVTVPALLSFIKKILTGFRTLLGESWQSVFSHDEDSKKELQNLKEAKNALEKKITLTEIKEKELESIRVSLRKEIEEEKDSSREAEKSIFRIIAEENKIRGTLSALSREEEALARDRGSFTRELEDAQNIIGQAVLEFKKTIPADSSGRALSREEITAIPREEQETRRREIEKIKIRLEEAGAGEGEEILKEYKEVSERDAFLSRELTDLEKSAQDLRILINDLGEKLRTEFADGITKINIEFQKFFELMFGGGTASLSITREKRAARAEIDENGEEVSLEAEREEKIEEGIEVSVSLPRKRIKGLMMLSGGERALTSIALLFAMSQVKPPPFVVLDETDAALDEANSRKYGDMVE